MDEIELGRIVDKVCWIEDTWARGAQTFMVVYADEGATARHVEVANAELQRRGCRSRLELAESRRSR